jgi:hypothetical protein
MAFFGRDTVLADLRMHRQQAGLVVAGTLKNRVSGTIPSTGVSYEAVCLWPVAKRSALGSGGLPTASAQLTAWRVGETTAPQVDGTWTVGGVSYLTLAVTPRHNHDESSNFAIYDCDVAKVA